MRNLFCALIVVAAGMACLAEASEARPAVPESPYALLAHESGLVFRLSRRTGHVWVEIQGAWKLIPTNTAFQIRDIQGPYPFQFQLVGTKAALVLMNGSDGKSQTMSIGPDPAAYKFVDLAEPKL